MIIPPSNLPEPSVRWADAIQAIQKDSRSELSGFDSDIGARYQGLSLMMKTLGSQLETLESYVANIPTVRIDFAQSAGFSVGPAFASKANLTVPLPVGTKRVSLYVVAQGYVKDTTNLTSNAQSRLHIGSLYTPESVAIVRGFNAVDERNGYNSSSAVDMLDPGGSVAIDFEMYNGNALTPVESSAFLACISTAYRA